MAAYKTLVSTNGLSREDWLKYRQGGIGGSDAAAIVGLNPYSSPTKVYADKLGFAAETPSNEAMRQGTDLEEYVARRFMDATGKKVRRLNAILQNVEHPFMYANVDRMVIGEKAGLECKTTSSYSKYDWESGDVPNTYYCQCQHYMATLGYSRWYLAVLVFSRGFYWYEIERNEDDIAALVAAEKEFWEEHVMKQVPPEPDGSAAASRIIRGMYDGVDGGEITLEGLDNDLARYDEIEAMMKVLETEKSAIAQRVQMQMGDAHVGLANGWRATWKPVTSTRIDSRKLKAEKPDVYEAYGKTSTSRRFSIKKEAV